MRLGAEENGTEAGENDLKATEVGVVVEMGKNLSGNPHCSR